MNNIKHIFIIGPKSLGAYGGYETFVDKITEYNDDPSIKFHVVVKGNGVGYRYPDSAKRISEDRYIYHNSDIIEVKVPTSKSAIQSFSYDFLALNKTIDIIKKEKISNPIVYILACRMAYFYPSYVRKIHKLGGKLYLNPDGHEWMRAKWSKPVKDFLKRAESQMVLNSDLIICDSINIEKYIREEYKVTNTTYIAYGAEIEPSKCEEDKFNKWLNEKGLTRDNYYLIVGRFVPENNYETMIKEYMKSSTTKDFAIICNTNDKLLKELEERLHYSNDKRIKFVGSVYDQELLKKIRENAYGYMHGHEVGGTNPTLLEALGSTKLNLLLKVGFNEEVGKDSCLYWTKEEGNLSNLINECETINREPYSIKAKQRIKDAYTWKFISDEYKKLWD